MANENQKINTAQESVDGLKGLRGLNYAKDNSGQTIITNMQKADSLGYAGYYSANKEWFDKHPEKNPQNSYLKYKVITDIGQEAYEAKYKGMPIDEMVSKYIAEKERSNSAMSAFAYDDKFREDYVEMELKDRAEQLDNEYNELSSMVNSANPEEKLKIIDRIKRNRNQRKNLKYELQFTQEELADLLADERYAGSYKDESRDRTELPKSKKFLKELDDYSLNIYNNALSSDFNRVKYMQMFENIASSVDPYYAESLKYNNGEPDEQGIDHEIEPFVNDMDKPKLMAKFLAISAMTNNENIAVNWLRGELLNMRKDSKSAWRNAYETVAGIGTDALSQGIMLVGLFKGLRELPAKMMSGQTAFNKEDADNDANFFQRLMFDVSDNDITKYGYQIMKTGLVFPGDKMDYYDENGLDSNDVSYSWGLNLIKQSGFTTASIFSAGVSALFTKAAQKGAVAVAKRVAKEGAKQVAKESAEKAITKVAKFTWIPMITSYPERTSDALDVYEQVMKDGQDKLEQLAYNDMEKRLSYNEQTGNFNDEQFNKYYQERSVAGKKFNELKNYIDSKYGNNFVPKTERDAIEYNALIEQLNKLSEQASEEMSSIAQSYYNDVYIPILDSEEAQRKIKTEAVRAFANTSATEGLIISCTDLLLSNMFKPMKSTLRKVYSGSKNPYIKIIGKGASRVAAAKGYNYVTHVGKDAFGEMVEEGFQNVTQDVNNAYANADLEAWFNGQVDPKQANIIGLNTLDTFNTIFKAFGESVLSKETQEAALMGFMGAIIGAADANVVGLPSRWRQNKADAQRYGYNKLETVLGYANTIWRSPLAYVATERRQHMFEANRIAKDINDKFESDPNFRKAFEGGLGMLNYMQDFNTARAAENKLDMDESDFGSYVAGINMLHYMKGTSMERSFYEALDQLEKSSLSDPAMRDAVDKMRFELNNEGQSLTDEDIVSMIKNRVTRFKELNKEYSKKLDEIEESYAGLIDDRTKNTLVYASLTKQNRQNLIREREDIISNEIKTNDLLRNEVRESALASNAEKALIARFGSIEEARKKYNEEMKKKASQKTMKKYELKQLKRMLKQVKTSDNGVLSALDIMRLDPISRAEMLNKSNRRKYSPEQQAVLKEMDDMGLSKDTITAIMESARIQKSIEDNDAILADISKSQDKLFTFQNNLRYNAMFSNLRKKFQVALEANDYESFEKAMDTAINSGRLTPGEDMFVGRLFSKPHQQQFYRRYLEKMSNKAIAKGAVTDMKMNGSVKTRKIVQAVLNEMIDRAKNDDNYKFNDAMNIFEDGGFKEKLRDEGIDIDSLSETEKNDLLSDIAEYVKLLNRACENTKSIMKSFNEEHEPDTRQQDDEKKEEGGTLIDKKIYEDNRDAIDPIFDKLSDLFFEEKKVKLTTKDLFILATLFAKKKVIPIDANTSELPSIDTNIASLPKLNEVIKDINKRLVDKKNLFGSTINTDMLIQMNDGLRTIKNMCIGMTPMDVMADAIIAVNPEYTPKFDRMKKDELKKKREKKLGKPKEMKLSIKVESALETDVEKNFYASHKITDNQIWVCDNVDPKNVRMRLMRTDELFDKEISEYNSDNYPLAVVMQTSKNTPNAEKIGEEYYLIVGIADNSRRSVTQEQTVMNEIRDMLLTDFSEEKTILKYEDTGNPIEFAGWNLERTKTETENNDVHVFDYLTKPANEGGLSLSEDEAYEHFKENVVVVDREFIKHDNGKVTITNTFEWNGKPYSYTEEGTAMPKGSMLNRVKYKQLAYIKPEQREVENPALNLLFTGMNQITWNGENLVDLFDKYDLFDKQFSTQGVSLVHNMLTSMSKNIHEAAKVINSPKVTPAEKNEAIANLNGYLNRTSNAYFNFKKAKGFEAQYLFKASIVGDKIMVGFYDGNVNVLGNKEVLELNIKDFYNKGNYKQKIQNFIKDVLLKKEDDGTYSYRTEESENGTIFTIKPQVNYNYFIKDKNDANDMLAIKDRFMKMYFSSNVLYMNKERLMKKIDGISSTVVVEQKKPEVKRVKLTQQEANDKILSIMNKLLAFEKVPKPNPVFYKFGEKDPAYIADLEKFNEFNSKSNQRKQEGSIGVTTFIKEGEVKGVNNEATNFGTGADTVVRMFFENGDCDTTTTYKKIREKVCQIKGIHDKELKASDCPIPGFTWSMLNRFLNDIHDNLYNFFEERGEKVIPFDMKLWANLKSADGRIAKLTMIPDIVTVDEYGGIHIYDMKSFRCTSQKVVSSFRPTGLKIFSGSWVDENMNEWRKQLSLYKHIFEDATGLNVESIGVIPISLFYNPGYMLSSEKNAISEANDVYTADGKEKKTFTKQPVLYNDAIKFTPMSIDEITSDKWNNPEEKVNPSDSIFNESDDSEKDNNGPKEEVKPTSEPKPVESVNTMTEGIVSEENDGGVTASTDELAAMLGLDDFSMDDITGNQTADELNTKCD